VTPFEVLLLGLVATVFVVAIVALRFPRGRAEWPLDARRTAWLLISGLTAVVVFALSYAATRDVRWPDFVTVTFVVVSLCLALLVAVSVFLPQGLRARP